MERQEGDGRRTGAEPLRPSNFEGRSQPGSQRNIPPGAAPLRSLLIQTASGAESLRSAPAALQPNTRQKAPAHITAAQQLLPHPFLQPSSMAGELLEAANMAEAELPELGMAALYIAVGCVEILKPLLDFLTETPARGPVLDAAAAAVVLTVPVAYLAGVTLIYLHVATAVAVPPAALGWFAVLVSAFLLFMALIFCLAAGVR